MVVLVSIGSISRIGISLVIFFLKYRFDSVRFRIGHCHYSDTDFALKNYFRISQNSILFVSFLKRCSTLQYLNDMRHQSIFFKFVAY